MCPRCANDLVTERGAAPWCSACEWNLRLYEPERHGPIVGWRRIDKRIDRYAHRLAQRQFDTLAGRPVGRPGWGAARVVVLIASVVLFALTVAMLGLGVWLIAYDFPKPTILPGAVLVLIAIALRPRFGRLDPLAHPIRRDEMPGWSSSSTVSRPRSGRRAHTRSSWIPASTRTPVPLASGVGGPSASGSGCGRCCRRRNVSRCSGMSSGISSTGIPIADC